MKTKSNINVITGTKYDSSFYKYIIKELFISKAIENRLEELRNQNGTNPNGNLNRTPSNHRNLQTVNNKLHGNNPNGNNQNATNPKRNPSNGNKSNHPFTKEEMDLAGLGGSKKPVKKSIKKPKKKTTSKKTVVKKKTTKK